MASLLLECTSVKHHINYLIDLPKGQFLTIEIVGFEKKKYLYTSKLC